MWHRLSNVANVAGVERQLATAQETWESEYNKFIAELSSFVNKEISEFRQRILSVGESTTQLQGTAWATSQRMESIQNQVTSIRPDLKEQIDWAVLEAKTELRTEMAAMVNRKAVSLETRMEAKINEVRQGTTSLLEELKTTVVAVRKSQENMGQALEKMSNKVQELVQKDAGAEDEEETDPWPAGTNWDEDLPAPSATSSWDQPLLSTPSLWLVGQKEKKKPV